jgi:hypothetical protein
MLHANFLKQTLLGLAVIGAPFMLGSCDDDDNGSPSNSESYSFDGKWRLKESDWGGSSYEHILVIGNGKITKYQSGFDVDGNRISCGYDTEKIKSYDKKADTVSLSGELYDDGTVITIDTAENKLIYKPEFGQQDQYNRIDDLPSGVGKGKCDNEDQ